MQGGGVGVTLQAADTVITFYTDWNPQVPCDWLLDFDHLRVESYTRKNPLPTDVYSDDQRKSEWFVIDRAIPCRRKFDIDGLCDVLAICQDNKGFEGYEFLVKWKGLALLTNPPEPTGQKRGNMAIFVAIFSNRNKTGALAGLVKVP